jgi:hypothetical protein
MDVADSYVPSKISNQPVAQYIIVSASRDFVVVFVLFDGVLIVNGLVSPDPHIS